MNLHMMLIDILKTYDNVSRKVLWRCREARGVPLTYIREHLGFVIHERGDINGDVTHRIDMAWMKRKLAFGVLCNKKKPHELKVTFIKW
ncbi:hypothetical protein H5410_022996 [Solanum commersonii]|uniref:Reverse transcriptase n=1 Tax=Solanum commersonii TaxID=4109 RepID=A0A9J5ZFL7_SOLCO|nr:hypothetical protein H5410_022996 [Solanum commersonii]